MVNTVGTPGYIGQVQKMDTSTPAYGPTFDVIHQQLLNNDAFLNSEILGMLQKAVNSGVIDYVGAPTLTGSLTARGQIYNGTGATWINAFAVGAFDSFINGYKVSQINSTVLGNSAGSIVVALDPAPTSNVAPSLPGSARDDLVFLEMWLDQTTGSPKWRIRVVDGVDFSKFPEGLGNPGNGSWGTGDNTTIFPQGGNALPVSYGFATGNLSQWSNAVERASTTNAGLKLATDDTGLYIAGDGSTNAKNTLLTLDGYVYAIPLFRVRRRNNAGFDPDTNPMGAQDYATVTSDLNAAYNPLPAPLNAGSIITINMSSALPSSFTVGKTLYRVGGSLMIGAITAINGTQITVTTLNTISSGTSLANNQFYVNADRPDGLYSNIIDASDITDLRHQVSLTGFNYQALLEKNLDLLLRGQLTTNAGARYARDYIGLNTANYVDDANTLLYLKFDGTMAGTANGTAVTNTKQGSGAETYKNGLQGQAADFSSGNYCEQYPVSLSASGSVEMAFKMPTTAPTNSSHFMMGYGDNTPFIRKFHVGVAANGSIYFGYYNDSGVQQGSIPTATGILQFGDNAWHIVRVTFNSGGITIYLDGVLVATTATAPTWTTVTYVTVGSGSDGGGFTVYSYKGQIDTVRLSNIVRPTDASLPIGFNSKNGDRILDGPNGDFSQWSDDLGGIIGVNGRTNPYGLSRVPNAVAARVSVNGSEIRHYYGNGLTPGCYSASTGANMANAGALEGAYSGEYVWVNANETVDGVATTFTFGKPANAQGLALLYGALSGTFQVNGTYTNVASVALNPSTGVITVTFPTPPASGGAVRMVYTLSSRHAHFIPSTKGFLLHDWTDDSLTADGVNKVFQTSRYNVTNYGVNHVRTSPTATPNIQTIQTASNYSVNGTNASTTLNANAALNATTLSVASGTNFVAGQNIRIAKGDGTWYTTTITSVSGTTLTVPAITVALAQNAVIQGAGMVTFTTAPAAGTVDLVYESVYTPALGDYIRVMYQHTPYQGTIAAGDTYTILAESNALVTSLGTGAVNTGSYSGTAGMTAATVNLPTTVQDYNLKNDAFIGTTRSSVTGKQMIQSTWDDLPYSSGIIFHAKRIGTTLNVSSFIPVLRGVNMGNSFASSGGASTLFTEQISAAVPTKTIYAALAKDQNGVLKTFMGVRQQSTNQPQAGFALDGITAADVFHIQGRPLIKGYGGVTA